MNSEVGQKLSEAGILWEQLGDKEQVTVKGLLIEGLALIMPLSTKRYQLSETPAT